MARWIPYVFGLLAGVVIGLSVLLYLVSAGTIGPGERRVAGSSTNSTFGELLGEESNDPPAVLQQSRRNAIVNAVEATRRSVVTISAAGRVSVRSPFHELFGIPFRVPRVESRQWIGSGFLIDPAGYIISMNHVVRGATDLVVTMGNGSSAHAELVGNAPRFDLALLRVHTDMELPAARLGDSDELHVGEWAIAIGSPFGSQLDDVQPSVSVGVISAVGRDLRPPEPSSSLLPGSGSAAVRGSWPYFDLLQTDAAINQGNSGGPLVNSSGEVIGVNMALTASAAGPTNVGVNFSVPINTVKWVFEELRDHGEVRTPWVGWHLAEAVPANVRRQINLAEEDGILVVNRIDADGPAGRAGIQPGDLVMSINGQEPYSLARAERILFDTRVGGEPLEVEILRSRDGQRYTVMVDVLENPGTQSERLRRRRRPLG